MNTLYFYVNSLIDVLEITSGNTRKQMVYICRRNQTHTHIHTHRHTHMPHATYTYIYKSRHIHIHTAYKWMQNLYLNKQKKKENETKLKVLFTTDTRRYWCVWQLIIQVYYYILILNEKNQKQTKTQIL